jgi:hypothetical protein
MLPAAPGALTEEPVDEPAPVGAPVGVAADVLAGGPLAADAVWRRPEPPSGNGPVAGAPIGFPSGNGSAPASDDQGAPPQPGSAQS